ncbi:hypothetical protein B7463_g11073, partial [Scytalidium lignicola]
MEIPPRLQERTDKLFQELRSELGKHVANEFVQSRLTIYYGDNEPSTVDPQALMTTDSPNDEDYSWNEYVCPTPDDSDFIQGDAKTFSNKDLDDILALDAAGRSTYSYTLAEYDHAYLKSLLKEIHKAHPDIVNICRILELTAKSLIRSHRLCINDDWDAISAELAQYI